MKKKHGKLLKDKNVIMFPGTVDRLVDSAHEYAEQNQYESAIECFKEAIQYEMLDEHSLGVYTYALYEAKRFEEARHICELLLGVGPTRYVEVMELYLSICMELRDFFHVQQLIRTLLDENVIEQKDVDKFLNILSLSEKLSNLAAGENEDVDEDEVEWTSYEPAVFFTKPLYVQLSLLQKLTEANARFLSEQLKAIIETEDAHPIVKSIALYVLVEQQVDIDLTISKFGEVKAVNPAHLQMPDELPVTKKVFEKIEEFFEKEGPTLEMVNLLLTRHILVTYPFEWFDYDVDAVVNGYNTYVRSLFGEEVEQDEVFFALISHLEKYSDVPEV